MAGFYVWHLTAEKYRQPYFVSLLDRQVFGGGGGLGSVGVQVTGDGIESFADRHRAGECR